MKSEIYERTEERLSLAVFMTLLLLGVVFLLISLLVSPLVEDNLIRGVLIGLGVSLLAMSISGSLKRYITPKRLKIEIVRGHNRIYKRFQKMLNSLSDEEPHIIRSLNSSPPEKDIGNLWDEFLLLWLKNHPDSFFHRVIVYQETPEWRERLAEMEERYAAPNYIAYEYEGPHVMEMFLIDEKVVLMSFSTHGNQTPRITDGIIIRDEQFCKLLKTYHEIHLRIGANRDRKKSM